MPLIITIPDDPLLEILTCCVHIGVDPFRLTSICKRWRALSFNYPPMWSHIILGKKYISSLNRLHAVEKRLELSSTFALDMVLNSYTHPVLDRLVLELPRWRSLKLIDDVFYIFWNFFSYKSAPLLESVSVQISVRCGDRPPPDLCIMNNRWPKLRAVEFKTINAIPYHLFSGVAPSVRELLLDFAVVNTSVIYEALSAAPNLESLMLCVSWSLLDFREEDIPSLTKLRTLKLVDRFNATWLTAFAKAAPALTHLHLSFTTKTPTSLLNASYPKLPKLTHLKIELFDNTTILASYLAWLSTTLTLTSLQISLPSSFSFPLANLVDQPYVDAKMIVNALAGLTRDSQSPVIVLSHLEILILFIESRLLRSIVDGYLSGIITSEERSHIVWNPVLRQMMYLPHGRTPGGMESHLAKNVQIGYY